MALDVDRTRVDGIWWRHVPAGGDPLFRPDPPPDGRWQRGSVVAAVYLADSEETTWAEWYRVLAELGIPPMHRLPRDLWRWEVSRDRVADLSTEARLARVGLALPPPGRWSWPGYQAIGEALWEEGWPALLAPSAARPGSGRILCLFRTARAVPGARPVKPRKRVVEPPVPPVGMQT
jgi:RES domain-containing protein